MTIAQRFRDFTSEKYWIWSLVGAIAVWFTMGMVTGRLNLQSLISNGVGAAFLAIPAIGQTLVVSNGRGSIDLSIPGVITLSAYLATGIINGQNINLPHGVLICLVTGMVIGFANSQLVLRLKIPPIIATLAMGYILTTASLLYNEGFAAFAISPLLTGLTRQRLLGIPLIIMFAVLIAVLSTFIVQRTTYGRQLIAVGQNINAAHFAGVNTDRVQMTSFMISGVLSALAGILLSARVGGAFLGMGDSYLLETVGAVVIGGTLIFGGRTTVVGTLFGCLFLVLTVTAMQVAGFPIGLQNILKGALIILVLVVATGDSDEG